MTESKECVKVVLIIDMSYISTITQKGQVTIPKPVRDFLGVSPRDRVVFTRKGKKIILKPVLNFMALRGSVKGKKYTDSKADRVVGKHIARDYGQEKG